MKIHQLYNSILIIFLFILANFLPLNTAQSAIAEIELSPEDEAALIEHIDELESWELIENMEILQNMEILEGMNNQTAPIKKES